VVVTFDGTEVKLYTNGQRLFTLADRRFMRSRVLRVFLGGQDEGDQAVYLAGLRITAGATAPMVLAAGRSERFNARTGNPAPEVTSVATGQSPTPAPRTIALSAMSATGLLRALAPASRTIPLAGITAAGAQGSGASPSPRTIALGEVLATGPIIAVKAPSRAIAGLPGTTDGPAAPVPRTIPLAGVTGSGGGGMAYVPVPRSIPLAGFSAAGNGERAINIVPRTINLPAATATGSGKTP